MNLDTPGLETSLIRLEPLAERHRADLLSRGVGDELWRLMPTIPAGNTLAAYFDHILRMPALGTGQGYAVILRETGAFIGFAVFLAPNKPHRRLRIGYTWLDKPWRGGTTSTHVHYLLLRRAIEWRARRVEWMMSTRSERGVALLERWEVQREGVLRQYSRMADGSWADVIVFSVVGDELADMVARLEKELAEDGGAASGP